jgi:hypothetical protein
MNDDENENGLIALVTEQLDTLGVTSALVKDGRLFLFKREFLEKMLTEHPDRKIFQILIKARGFEN